MRSLIAIIVTLMYAHSSKQGQIAQSVEQRTENPCVAGSIPVLANLSMAHTLF